MLGALMLAAFTFNTAENLPIGLLDLISESLRVSLPAVGLLVTGYGLTVAVASLPLAHVPRAVPRRHVLTGLLAALVVSSLVAAPATSYGVLLAARLLTAVAQALFWAVTGPVAVGLFGPEVQGRGGRGAVRRRFARPRPRCPRRDLAGPAEPLAGAHRRAGGAGARLTRHGRRPAADLASGEGTRRLRNQARCPPVRDGAGGGSAVRHRGVRGLHLHRDVPGRGERVLPGHGQRPLRGLRCRVSGRGEHHRDVPGPLPTVRTDRCRGHAGGGHARPVRVRYRPGGCRGVPGADGVVRSGRCS